MRNVIVGFDVVENDNDRDAEILEDILKIIGDDAHHRLRTIRTLFDCYRGAEDDFDSENSFSASYMEYFDDRRRYAMNVCMKVYEKIVSERRPKE